MRGVAMVGVALGSSACGSGDAAPDVRDVTVRDSADITIVESGAPPTRPAFVLDTVPALDIGEREDDDPDYQLFQVRGAVRRRDGGVVVGNGGANELRVYDASGTFVRRIGRKGQGPGEFEDLTWLRLSGADTIVTYDWSGRRLSRFTPDGEYVASDILGGANNAHFLFPVGQLDDGRILATVAADFAPGSSSDGISRDSATLLIATADGEIRDTVLRALTTERIVSSSGSGANRSMSVTTPLFGRMTSFSAAGNMVVVATADSYEVRQYDATGALRRVIRRRTDPVPVTETDVAALRAERLTGDMPDNLRRRIEQQMDAMELPPEMPPYTTVFVDRIARIWVREAAPMGAPGKWAVFDGEGALAAELELPARFRITEAGDGYVLGVLRDEDDLERVQLFRLRAADSMTASSGER